MKKRTIDQNEVLISYDLFSLFTEVPLDETIDYIFHQIYFKNTLPPITSRCTFKRLLSRTNQGSVLTFNGQLYKQIDGCGMGNPLSPVIANILSANQSKML